MNTMQTFQILRVSVRLSRILVGVIAQLFQRFHGDYVSEIEAFKEPASNIDEPFKKDLWKFTAGLTSVTAEIKRIEPEYPKKRWRFVGKEIDGNLMGFFWNEDPDILSRGVIYVRPDPMETGRYKGKYLRWREEIRDVIPIPLSLRRLR